MAETPDIPEATFEPAPKIPPKDPQFEAELDEILGSSVAEKKAIKKSFEPLEVKAQSGPAVQQAQQSLKGLVQIAGPDLNIQTPEQMEQYLIQEALKERPTSKYLRTPEAGAFFSGMAQAQFGYKPKSDTWLYHLDAFREGVKKETRRREDEQARIKELHSSKTRPDALYFTLEDGKVASSPRWSEETELQAEVFDKLNLASAGQTTGNLTGLVIPQDLQALQGQTYAIPLEDLQAMEADEVIAAKQGVDTAQNELTAAIGSPFHNRKFTTKQVYVHQAPVAGNRKAVNLYQFKKDFEAAYHQVLAQEKGYTGYAEASRNLTPEDLDELNAQADKKAISDIKRIQMQSRPGTIFIDDPEKLVRDIRKGEDPLAYTSPIVQSAAALKNLGLISEGSYDAVLAQRGPWASIWYPPSMRQFNQGTLTYAEQVEDISPGTMHWLMTIAPTTPLGAYVFSDNPDLEYGSIEHLTETRHYDFVKDLGNAGTKLAEAIGAEGTLAESSVALAGSTAALLLMFFEPDLITLATLPIGGTGKLGKMGAKGAAKAATGADTLSEAAAIWRLKRYDTLIDDADSRLAAGGFTDSKEVAKFFKEQGAPELAAQYDMQLMSQLAGVVPTATKQARNYSHTLDAMRSGLANVRKEINKLEGDVSSRVQKYIEQHGRTVPEGHVPFVEFGYGKVENDRARQLWKAKSEEAVLSLGQLYAKTRELEAILENTAGRKGVFGGKSGLDKAEDASLFTSPRMREIEDVKAAWDSYNKNLTRLADKEQHLAALDSLRNKLTKNQRAARRKLTEGPDSIGALKRQMAEEQELIRDRFNDAALTGAYKKFENSRNMLEDQAIQVSKYVDLKSTLPSGKIVDEGAVLRDTYKELRTAEANYAKEVKRVERNLKQAKTRGTKTQQKWREELDRLMKPDARQAVVASRKAFNAQLDKVFKASVDEAPSLKRIGDNFADKVRKEAREYAAEAAPLYMRNSLQNLKDSVGTLRTVILKNRSTRGSRILDEGLAPDRKYVRGLDPDDSTKVVFDRQKYLDDLVQRYVTESSDDLQDVMQGIIDQSGLVKGLKDLPAHEWAHHGWFGPHVTLSGRQLQDLRNLEDVLLNQQRLELEGPTAIAKGLVRTWQQPVILRNSLLAIANSDPLTWFKGSFPRVDQVLGAAVGATYRQARRVQRAFDPGAHRFGDFNENVLNSAKIATTRQSRAMEELTLLSDNWVRKGANYKDNVVDYLTSQKAFTIQFRGQKAVTKEGLGVGTPAIMNQGEFTPWQGFKQYIRGLEKPEESLAIKAIAYAYVARGAEASAEVSTIAPTLVAAALDALKKAEKARGPDGAAQFKYVMEQIQKKTGETTGLDPDSNRAFSFAAKGVLHGSVANDFLYDLARSGGISISAEGAHAANTVLTQVKAAPTRDNRLGVTVAKVAEDYGGARYGFSPAEAFKALEQYGIGMDGFRYQTIGRQLQRLDALTSNLISVNRAADPAKVQFVPQGLIKKIEEEAGKISKDLAAITLPNNRIRQVISLFSAYLRAWRKNVILGTVVPRAAYFSNQFAGDFSQLHLQEGFISLRRVQLGTQKDKIYVSGSAPLMFQNAFTYVPYFGNWVQDYLLTRTKDATRAGRKNVLTTPLQAFLSSPVSQLMRMGDDLVETKEGMRTVSQLMEEALADGVFDTLMTDDLYKMMDTFNNAHRNSLGARISKTMDGADNFARNWGDMVTTIQGRQRLALYAEYRLMRGEARSAAKTAVNDALFDWRHGVTEWEMATIGQIVAFYPFFRLAARQFQRSILEGMTKPSMDLARKAMVGQTKIARLRSQGRMAYSIPSYVWGPEEDEALSEQQMRHELYRRMRPWWVGSRPAPTSDRMPIDDQIFFQRKGHRVSYYTTTYPMWTALDMADLYSKLFSGITGSMMYYGSNGQIRPTYDNGGTINKTVLDFLNPGFKAAAQGAYAQVSGSTDDVYQSPKGMRLRVSEQAAYKMYSNVPFLGSLVTPTPDKSGYYVPTYSGTLLRSLPVIGTDLPNTYAQLHGANPKWSKGATAGMGWFVRQWTGIGKQVPFDPQKQLDYTDKDIVGALKKELKILGSQAESKGGPEAYWRSLIDEAEK